MRKLFVEQELLLVEEEFQFGRQDLLVVGHVVIYRTGVISGRTRIEICRTRFIGRLVRQKLALVR